MKWTRVFHVGLLVMVGLVFLLAGCGGPWGAAAAVAGGAAVSWAQTHVRHYLKKPPTPAMATRSHYVIEDLPPLLKREAVLF